MSGRDDARRDGQESGAEGPSGSVRVFVLDTDGRAAALMLGRGADGTCADALRSALGCRWFDVVRLSPDRLDMWVDDEGLSVDEPATNVVASRIAMFYGFSWQVYAGRVVFASHDGEGRTTSLTDGQVAALAASVREWDGRVVDARVHPAGSVPGVLG